MLLSDNIGNNKKNENIFGNLPKTLYNINVR